jgi:periplasmic divalent cation tolerance protein
VGALVVVTTVGTEEEANRLAEEMVGRRHSACVNIVPIHRSVYRWQGKICDDREYLLVIKTLEREYEAVEATVRELHSYELPEILAFQVSRGEARFLDWITQSLDKSAQFADDDGDGGGDDDEDGDNSDSPRQSGAAD